MKCDVCGKPVDTKWITGNFCSKHEGSLSVSYFAWLKEGKTPSEYVYSAEREKRIADIRAQESQG